MISKGHALSRDALIRTLTAYLGITTEDGEVVDGRGITLVDSNLKGRNDFISEKTILIMSGEAKDEDKGATEFDNADGKISLQGTGFSAQIKAGTIFRVLNISSIEIDVANIKAQTDKLAGAAPGVGTATENWNAAEADIVSIGADNTKNKLHSLVLNISALTATATISIRMYMQVNGVERKVYDQDFVKGTDPDGLWIVNGMVGIHEVLRVTAQSDNAGDDGKAIDYDYMLEAM